MNESLGLPNLTVAVSGFTDRFVCSTHILFAAELLDRSTHTYTHIHTHAHTQKEAANRKAIILGLNVCVIELIKHQRNTSLLDWPG